MKIKAFIDSHLHLMGMGYYEEVLNLNDAKSLAEIIDLAKKSENEVIIGRGFNQDNLFEKRMPEALDFQDIEKPMVLFRICGHVAVANQLMIDLIKEKLDILPVSGGSFNLKTGLFTENALAYLYQALPRPTKNDLVRYIAKANNILLKNGITKVASDDFSSFDVPFEMVIEAYKEATKQGLLDVEVTQQVNLPIKKLEEFCRKGYANKKYHNYRMGPLKVLADGSLGGRTAAMNEPYSDDLDNLGILTYTDSELYDLIKLATKNNMDSVIHAIGDRAADQVIDTLIKVQEEMNVKSPNNAIIHAQVLNKNQIEKMKKHQIGAIVQPVFINSDIQIVYDRLKERSYESYLFKTMYENIPLGFSTDCPVEAVNPFKNIYCSITRKSADKPEFDAFLPEEGFTLEEALKAYTDNNLRYVYSESQDDYLEIDRDIFSVENEELLSVSILKTYKNGKIVYERKN